MGELDSLKSAAAAVDEQVRQASAPAPMPEAELAPAPIVAVTTEEDEVFGGLSILVKIGQVVSPSLALLYTDEVMHEIANAAGPVMRKHAWRVPMGKYAEEIKLAGIVLPIAFATVQVVRADLAALEKKSEPTQENTAGPKPGEPPTVATAPADVSFGLPPSI